MGIVRHLERIADHAVNIAEDIIYLIEGTIVRHQLTEPNGGTPPPEARRTAATAAPAGAASIPEKTRVLFLCDGNSCRSQMAEGWARHLKGDVIEACSAGIAARGLDPRAVVAMAEAGVDISGQRSKSMDEFKERAFDFVVTLCDSTRDRCPVFPGPARRIHAGFDDPPRLAQEAQTEEEARQPYRRVRDEIRAWVENLPDAFAERA
jgi:arsenate reductase